MEIHGCFIEAIEGLSGCRLVQWKRWRHFRKILDFDQITLVEDDRVQMCSGVASFAENMC